MQTDIRYSVDYPGFAEVPGYSRYVVSDDGQVINKLTGEFLTGAVNPAGYHNVRLTSDNGSTLTWGRHRLVKYVFEFREDYQILEVNHKKGIKADNRNAELEWSTPKGNTHHAGLHGLSPKVYPTSIRFIDSGDIYHFGSTIECARFLNEERGIPITKWQIRRRLGQTHIKVFPERIQYRRLTNDNRDAPWEKVEELETLERELQRYGRQLAIKVYNARSKTTMTFASLLEASQTTGVKEASLSTWLKDNDRLQLRPRYLRVKLEDDEREWPEVDDLWLAYDQEHGRKHVVTIEESTGNVTLYLSSQACAAARGLSKTALSYRIKQSNGQYPYPDGYRYAYYLDVHNLVLPDGNVGVVSSLIAGNSCKASLPQARGNHALTV